MADVVGVVFPNGSKTYHFDPAGLELSRGDRVVVQTMKGIEIGQVVDPPHVVDDSELPAPLKKVLRVATGEDLQAQASGDSIRKEALATCRELIASHGLDMKLVDAEVSFGGEKIIFSFYSEERVDFRALVADLARTLKTRIELRQIGAREEARMVGGLGPCGRRLCCCLFQGDEDPVSIRMAKEQNLPLNPMKISGLCGRLMCCLKYEQEQYVTFRKEAPPKGTRVKTGDSEGAIVGYNVLKDAVVVRYEDGSVTDVRLSTCERGDDGCLVCVWEAPQANAAAIMPGTGYSGLGSVAAVEEVAEELEQAVASEVAETAQPTGEAGGGEQEGKSERRGRSRRGRRGKGTRGSIGAASGAEGDEPSGQAGAAAAGGRSGGRTVRRKAAHKPGSHSGVDHSGEAVGDGGNGENSSRPKGPRRRRRARRRGPGSTDNGSGGNGGGEG